MWLPEKIIFNHAVSNFMKSLSIIWAKSAKVTSKQCSGAISISLFCVIKLFKVFHLLFIILFVYSTYHFTNFGLSYTFFAFRLRKVSTLTSKQVTAKSCSSVLDFSEQLKQRVQRLLRPLARTDFKSI